MHIRIATLDDISALNKVARESVGVLSRNYYSSEQIAIALVHVFDISGASPRCFNSANDSVIIYCASRSTGTTR